MNNVAKMRRGAGHRVRNRLRFHTVVGVAVALTNVPALASDVTLVSSCSQQQPTPIKIRVDCSHLKDSATKDLCGRFAENQTCKVLLAYRKITGIHVERRCPTVTYTIYDRHNWPNVNAAGGMSVECRVDYLAEYALQPNARSAIGPYEVHEILHQYQMADETLDELTAFHPLFSSSMLEAEREVGDMRAYQLGIAQMKDDSRNLRSERDEIANPPAYRCSEAQAVVEEGLYLQDSKNVYQFYRLLANGPVRNPMSRLSAMLNTLSGGAAKAFLLAHGCQMF